MRSSDKIQSLLSQIDGRFEHEWPAVKALKRELGEGLVPHLAKLYEVSRNADVRESCVYHCMGFAEEGSPAAVELGIRALEDRSRHVRYRACMLLSFAQDKSALPALHEGAAVEGPSREDFLAAIDAIENENRHYFVDRDHSGMVTLHMTDLSSE